VAEYRYTVVFEPAEEGGYVVTVPALPGLVTEGETLEEARAMVKDAIRGYLESLIKHGEEIPIEPAPASVERVAVTI
jgi:antitoxin HicB